MDDRQFSVAELEAEMCTMLYVIGTVAGSARTIRWMKGYDTILMIVDAIKAGLYNSGIGTDDLATLSDAFWKGHFEGLTSTLVKTCDDLPMSA